VKELEEENEILKDQLEYLRSFVVSALGMAFPPETVGTSFSSSLPAASSDKP